MADTPKNVKEIFLAVVEQSTPEARAAVLEQACVGQPELRRRVLDLVEAHDAGDSFLARPALEFAAQHQLPEAGTPLGDYRLLREIGRGGMGVVYEAEQLSLQRRVALKVLPFAAALDAKQLQRFKNEAQAAANLHHQNIVPVYGVGCERGVHYYAMQFIEGRTLAALIQERRAFKGLDAADSEVAHGSAPTTPAWPPSTSSARPPRGRSRPPPGARCCRRPSRTASRCPACWATSASSGRWAAAGWGSCTRPSRSRWGGGWH